MKKRFSALLVICIAVLAAGLFAWRLLPLSCFNIFPVSKEAFTGFSAQGIFSNFEKGHSDLYSINNPEPLCNEPEEIIEILAASKYRQDFRNLLPWGIDNVSADNNYEGSLVTLNLYCQGEEGEYINFQFLSSSIVVVRMAEQESLRIYHPTNSTTFQKLVEYLQIYGVTSDETALPTEPTQAATLSTEPLHSELYDPQYTTAQIQEYFSEVVLNMEYSTGDGDATLVQKWLMPIYYRVYGTPTDEDLETLNEFADQLNEVPGFPGIYPAGELMQENLSVYFVPMEEFNQRFSDVISGEYANGAVQFWYYTDTNEIHTAQIGCRTDIAQSVRNSVLLEEIVNGLGITDTVLREDSLVYQYSDDNMTMSDVDWILMKLLYDPQMQCGMDYEACIGLIDDLYY